jgi:hypothetical protein
MLSERYRQLLTAYVDGELSGRQRRHVIKLLRHSREARHLLRELQGDSQVLRAMARPKTPVPDISLPILQTIAERRLRPGQIVPASSSAPTGVSVWRALLAVAAVLIVVSLGSYLFFRAHFARPDTPYRDSSGLEAPAAETIPSSKDASTPAPGREPLVNHLPPAGSRPQSPADTAPAVPPIVKGPGRTETPGPTGPLPAPVDPREPTGPVLTSPQMEIFKFEEVKVPPTIILGEGLEKELDRKRLTEALRKDSAFRVELPCREGTHALRKLQMVWKAQHANLVIEPAAQARLKKLDHKTNYVLYINNVMPEELTDLLRQLEIEDRKAKESEQQFKAFVVRGMTRQDHKELSDLLGIDPGPLTSPSRGAAGGDDKANQGNRGMEGARPEPAKTGGGRPPEFQTLALSYNPVGPSKGGPEIKHFLEGRKPPRPGSIQVLLILRGMGS